MWPISANNAARRLCPRDAGSFARVDETRLAKIAENLHRAELSKLERSENVGDWARLTLTDKASGQLAQKPQGGRAEGGISAAAREIGVERTEVGRADKIASISDAKRPRVRPSTIINQFS